VWPGARRPGLPRQRPSAGAGPGAAQRRRLMDRMGHDSARAALIYQHKTTAAGQVIADALSAQIEALEQRDDDRPATG